MKLEKFQVMKFRNFIDSGEIEVDAEVTCFVGKNESGKSALFEALYLLNPVYGEEFDVDEHYPRWLTVQDRRSGDISKAVPIRAWFELNEDDCAAVNDELGEGAISPQTIVISKQYSGKGIWKMKSSEAPIVKAFANTLPELHGEFVRKYKTLDDLASALVEASQAPPVSGDEEQAAAFGAPEATLVQKGLVEKGLDGGSFEAIAQILKQRLPKFFRFSDYQTLPGRIDFHDLASVADPGPASSGLRTAQALIKLAETDLERLGDDAYELRKGELEAVSVDLTNQVFEYWKQNPSLAVTIDVDKETVPAPGGGQQAVARFLDVRIADKRTGYSNNFDQRSTGFQWFFSFLAAFSEFETLGEDVVILLDEPALGLHGRAQSDFLRFIDERLAVSSQVLYTTHSPFMVDISKIERVRMVEDRGPDDGAKASSEVLATDPDTLFPLQAALGYDIAQNLFVGRDNLVVEGISDFVYLSVMGLLLEYQGKSGLDQRWRVLPAGGATNIATFVALVGPALDVTVVIDANARGFQRVQGMVKSGLLKPERLIVVTDAATSKSADIEDLFSEGDYLKLYNGAFGVDVKVKDLPLGDRIVKRLETFEGEFNHGKPADYLLRHHAELTFAAGSLDRFEALMQLVNNTLS